MNITNTDGPRQILALESTGVIDTTGWQNISANTTNIDSTVVDITFAGTIIASNTARDAGNPDGTNGFLALYEAGLRDSDAEISGNTFVTISDMTAYLAAESAISYTIYGYYKSFLAAVSPDTIALGLTTGSLTNVDPDGKTISFADSFVESSNAESNYIVFTGLTADSTTLFLNRVSRDGLLTGIQIETVGVVPEPSSIVLLSIGAIGLCGYGYRRKRKLAA